MAHRYVMGGTHRDIALYEGRTLNITAVISRYSDAKKERMIDKYQKVASVLEFNDMELYNETLLIIFVKV